MSGLSSARRRELKARAHTLDPVVMIGAGGLTPGLLAEIERSLKSHELIKVRAVGADRSEREAMLEEISKRTGAHCVQHIGKILVLFRKNPESPLGPGEDSVHRKRRGR